MRTRAITIIVLLALAGSVVRPEPFGTSFTYQGKLTDGGVATGGPITNSAIFVTNGMFTTILDFGPGTFTGDARWLEIAVRTNGASMFTVLSPRQPMTPVPYALFSPVSGTAATASSLSGTLGPHQLAGPYTNAVAFTHPANNVAGSFSGDGAGLNNVNAAALGGVPPSGFWQTGGNTGIVHGRDFLGTLDNQVLELRVNNAPALRLEPSQVSPNVIGGFSGNTVVQGSAGSVIGGGGAPASINLVASDHATIGGGLENMILSGAHSATVGGGAGNQIQPGAAYATVGGGVDNRIGTNSIAAAIAGGDDCTVGSRSSQATIGGGSDNNIGSDAPRAFVGGGESNTIQDRATHAVLVGGERNIIQSDGHHAVLVGGLSNTANGEAATVGGGTRNSATGMYGTVAGGTANTAMGEASTVSGGSSNIASGRTATIGGGEMNRAEGSIATIGGGGNNTASGYSAVVSGGYGNTASGRDATVAGGLKNTASGDFATVPGGEHNLAAGVSALAAGRKAEALHAGAFVWADSTDEYFRSTGTNQFIIRAGGGVGINTNHPQSALHVAGTITADDFRGRGAGLSGVDADRLDGRDSTEFALLTHTHNAADIANGTLADARLSANSPRLNATQTFAGANQFTNPANTFAGTFQGQGSGLGNLDAGNITSGTLSDARLSTNIPRLNAPANYTSTVSAPVMQASNVVADASSLNNGAIMPGLVLGGTASGEGIASKRTTGGNQFGLDLFTAFTSRFAIENNGSIHIGAGNSFGAMPAVPSTCCAGPAVAPAIANCFYRATSA
ncbi:MAG: hypothetical protein QHJ82_05780 [Verrucomicrobiota bacterium]|nr:hypothetical protein [Verrucomicrobiota bacterium]